MSHTARSTHYCSECGDRMTLRKDDTFVCHACGNEEDFSLDPQESLFGALTSDS